MSGYPKNLLPSPNDTILSDADLKGRMVARRHDPSKEGSIFEADGSIDASLIFYKRFAGFSCNLKPPSNCEDLKIDILNEDLRQSWNVGDPTHNISESDYEIKEDREVYEFPYDDIVSSKLPYVIEGNTYNLTINIIHKPLLWNYSHCEFELVPSHPNSASFLDNLSSSSPAYHQTIIQGIRGLMEKYSKRCEQ